MDPVTNEQGGYEPPRAKKTSPIALIGGGVIIGGLVIALGFFAYTLLASGGDAASALPIDTVFYVGADMTKLLDDDAVELFEVFRDAMDDDEIIDDMTEEFEDALGVTFEDDIAPWIGASMGLSVYDLDFGNYGDVDDGKFVFVFSVRDTDAADEFIEDITDHLEDENDWSFDDSEYEGAIIWLEEDYEEFAIARYKKYLYISNGDRPIEDAIDAAKGESLADLDEYKDVVKELPGDRLFTMYVSSEFVQDIMDAMADSYIDLGDVDIPETSYGASMMITNDGLQFDLVSSFDEGDMPDAQIEMLKAQSGNQQTAEMYPEDTFLFIASQRIDLALQMLEETSDDAYDEFEESMELFDKEYEIDVLSLLQVMDGEFSFGLYKESSGYFADYLDVPLGWQFVAETSDEGEFADAFDDLADYLEDDGYMSVDDDSFDEVEYYVIGNEYSDGDIFAFGSGESLVFLASDIDTIEDGYENKDSLADSDIYKATWKAFSGSTNPVFFFDVREFIDMISEANDSDYFDDSVEVFEPITILAGGVEKYSKGKTHAVMILFVEK